MIYLASPYTHPKQSMMEARVAACAKIVTTGMEDPKAILPKRYHKFSMPMQFLFSPIVHGHYVEQLSLDVLPYESWIAHGLDALNTCTSMIVADLPGWEKSQGVAMEIEEAHRNAIPVSHLTWSAIRNIIPRGLSSRLEEDM